MAKQKKAWPKQKKSLPDLNKRLNYARDYTITASGERIYNGMLFEFIDEDKTLDKTLTGFARYSVLSAVILLISGFLPAASMKLSPFVLFPFALSFICGVILAFSCFRLTRIEQPFERRDWDTTFKRIKPLSFICAVLSAITFVGNLVFIFTHLFLGVIPSEYVFSVFQGVVTVIPAVIFTKVKKIRFRGYLAKSGRPAKV